MTVQQDAGVRRSEADWDAIERMPEYRELERAKRRFVVPATAGYLAAYFGFLLLAGLAPGVMGAGIYKGITLGWLLLAGMFALAWTLVFRFGRTARRDWDPRSAEIARRADAARGDGDEARTGARRRPSRDLEATS
jgi:uncharacterized membrane protein (DUF485 family)